MTQRNLFADDPAPAPAETLVRCISCGYVGDYLSYENAGAGTSDDDRPMGIYDEAQLALFCPVCGSSEQYETNGTDWEI